MAHRYSRQRIHGFSVVELMVAVGVSVLLLAGVISIFASSRNSYETTDRTSRIQESGRLALDIIARHIRSSGFVGCARQPTYVSTSLNDSTALQWNFLEGPVRGFEFDSPGTWLPTRDSSIPLPLDETDILVLRVPAREAIPLPLLADMAGPSDVLTVANVTTGVQLNDVAIAFSCEAQSVFQVTNFAGGTITHAAASGSNPGNDAGSGGGSLNYTYRRDVTHVLPVETVVYYVAPSSNSATTPSLWRKVALNPPEELVEGIERMEVKYGVDTTGDVIVDEYRDANLVTDWTRVISVSVALLVRSLEEYGADPDLRTYRVLDASVVAPNDRRLREVFTATATIRNRVRVN